MNAPIVKARWWIALFLGTLALAILTLTAVTILGAPSLLLPFFAHIGVGLAVTGFVVEFYHFPMTNVALSKLPAILMIATFGLSDFVWGGMLFDRDLQTLAAFLFMGAIGLWCIARFGQRGKS